mmetsp:Transcript_11247/g.18847  ORF Transcript_11247/g.18847 Transcript_11247/m.18847 type:complete len:270 (+) Transcript_11247:48-857(+)|eukprot:CAMPEP_0119330270 /NCGR_PEP_ID=MMETSP1333-20130426/77887_1 /TAXON_ID=418940 /ORGANISM="Scyphosphaera apsteinii, Strain RCC1455" /LENGTH=269 /DNA_ID=CAMNT_0007339625 /DNA_START=29 /DNA_END=838 /DNA_ORIENTATION=+
MPDLTGSIRNWTLSHRNGATMVAKSRQAESQREEVDIRCKRALADRRPTVTVSMAGNTFVIAQQPCAFDTGLRVWGASEALAALISTARRGRLSQMSGRRVCELGAGCGVSGMACAVRGAQVTFTDQPHMVAHLRKNVEANLALESDASVVGFTWGSSPSEAGLKPPYDFVIAADPLVSEEVLVPLSDSLLRLCGSHSVAVISCEARDSALLTNFNQHLRTLFASVDFVTRRTLRRAIATSGTSANHTSLEDWVTIAVCSRLRPAPIAA